MRIFKKSNQYVFVKWVRPILEWAKKVTLPGFDKTPIYNVGTFFLKGIKDGAIETRAAAVSFNLFLSLFLLGLVVFYRVFEVYKILKVKFFTCPEGYIDCK